ncbi:Hypothetical predicted protein [Paramuricea clavata]|uniref:Uncharacterized protein n=1 Tax=Paramuricea clavata TaxID=317549 RepID=A0A6S7HF67_PARCT|nr:Hypothetical predicted protein [Paramuricea clavata]
MPRFNVATYVKEQKRLREKVVLENRQLKSLQDEISAAAKLKEEKRMELNRIRENHRRLDNKVRNLVKAIEDLNDIQNELVQPDSTDQSAAEVGIIDTALVKCSKDILVIAMSSSKKFNKSVLPIIYKKSLKTYEASEDNLIRSVAVYYSGGVTGKKKYCKIYKYSCYRLNKDKTKNERLAIDSCPLPRLVPYNRIMPYIKSISLGTINSVTDTLCYGLDECDKVTGCYRNLKEMLIKLAEFYLSGCTGHSITWFEEPYTFSVGGDGAPFGKDDTPCAWLISLLNIGRGVLSSNENYLLFGANCRESCIVVQRFIKMLLTDIRDIEKSVMTCSHNGQQVNVKFSFTELPNDMKIDDAKNTQATFGRGIENTWKPWMYSDRLKVVNEVEKLKAKLSKQPLSDATKKSKVTSFIAQKKSRQEFEPPLGNIIDKAHVEPLHLKNNACALAHRYLLLEVFEISNLPDSIKLFSQVPSNSPIARYKCEMETKCGLSRLAKRIVRWFNKMKAASKALDYRFTGKDSRGFLHNFMYLIAAVEPFQKHGSRQEFTLHVLSYLCLMLHKCVTLFDLVDLQHACKVYFHVQLFVFCSSSHCLDFRSCCPSSCKGDESQVWYGARLELHGRS